MTHEEAMEVSFRMASVMAQLNAMTAERDALAQEWKDKYADLEEEHIALRKQLAAVTAEREALKAQLAAVPVKAIDFYFFHVDEEVAMIDADIPGNPEAMVNAAVQIGDWLNSTRR